MRVSVIAACVPVLLSAVACTAVDEADVGTGPAGPSSPAEESAVPEGPPTALDASEQPLPSETWSVREAAPLTRTEVAAAAFGGQLWVAGGLDPEGAAAADVQIYDPALDSWSDGPALPRPVHHAALVSTGEELYLLGGYVDGWVPSFGVFVLDPASGSWEEGPALPDARGAGAAAFDGTRIVYAGGVGFDGLAGDVWGLAGNEWSRIGSLSPPREHLGAASDGEGRAWFLGGREGGLETNRAEVDLVEGDSVEPVGTLPTPRGGVTGFYAPGAGACMVGGEGPQGTFREVECLSTDGEVTALPALADPRHGLGAGVIDDNAFVALGGPEPGLTVSGTLQALRLAPTP